MTAALALAADGQTVAGMHATLTGAARVLEQVGLCQGQEQDLTGRVSVLRALHIVVDGDWPAAERAAQLLERWLQQHDHTSITRWSDAIECTEQHVVDTLRQVAAALRTAPPAMTCLSPAARS